MTDSLSTNQIISEGSNALKQLMHESETPILVKFVASHCPACKILAPVLQQLAADSAGKIHLVTIDMTEDPDLAIEFGVRSAPTVLLFKSEAICHPARYAIAERIAGLKPKKVYSDAIQKAIAND